MSPNARDRLLETATRLFAERGLSRVGINEIIGEAQVARMSLYNNFSSKEDLALAAYKELSEARHSAIAKAVAVESSPKAAILTVFDVAIEIALQPQFRGCAFLNLSAHVGGSDGPLLRLIQSHKAALRDRFTRLAQAHGHADPDTIGRQLLALWDGSISDAFIEGDPAAIRAARMAAEQLLGGEA